MKHWAIWDDGTNKLVWSGGCSYVSQLPPMTSSQRAIEISDSNTRTLAIQNGKVTETDIAVSIEVLRARRWLAAKAYRQTRIDGGCSTPLGKVQTDIRSRQAISETAADAQANQVKVPAWSVSWIMADNSVKSHSVAQMIAMGAAVRTYVAACQTASQAVRVKINAATTAAAVAAIDITAGYPT